MSIKIAIINCSNPFAWYVDIPKIKEEKRQPEKVFEVENDPIDGYYRTIDDVRGPNVKGFINIIDVISEEEFLNINKQNK